MQWSLQNSNSKGFWLGGHSNYLSWFPEECFESRPTRANHYQVDASLQMIGIYHYLKEYIYHFKSDFLFSLPHSPQKNFLQRILLETIILIVNAKKQGLITSIKRVYQHYLSLPYFMISIVLVMPLHLSHWLIATRPTMLTYSSIYLL